jgi:hypothetical protein
MHEINNLKMTQSSLVGGYERYVECAASVFRLGNYFFPENGDNAFFFVTLMITFQASFAQCRDKVIFGSISLFLGAS